MTVIRWQAQDLRDHVDDAMSIYCAAMGYPPGMAEQRKGYVIMHTRRDGFRAAATLGDAGRLVGFGYGYAGAEGQWWHDEVRRAVDPGTAAAWLADSFELCELHVLPDWQGHGLGQRLLTTLLSDCPQSTVLLSTPEGDSRAWRLYRRMGFADVHRRHRFPGDDREFAVLGRRLPLDVATIGAMTGS